MMERKMSVTTQQRDIFIAHGWEKSHHIHRITELLDRATDFDDQFAYINHGTADTSVNEKIAGLEYEVQNQIKESAVVLVLTDLYNDHKVWIDKELEMAKSMNKPVIVIRSFENKETPSHLEVRADQVVVFEPEEILKVIKNYG